MKKIIQLPYLIILVFTISFTPSLAQSKINILRYDDDFSQLKNKRHKRGIEHLKNISLGKNCFISFGGELREQFQFYNNLNFGDVPPNYPDKTPIQLWHRFTMHSNIELGTHFRVFVQLNNTLRFLNPNPIVPEIDENQLSLHQAFAEIKIKNWTLRIGRQELLYGNNRLVTVREGPNTRLTFDGIVIKKISKNGNLDFLAVSKVNSMQYIFDDQSFKEVLIGFYGTQRFINHKMGLDYFLVNLHSKSRKYNYQTGLENRQTYGVRLFSNLKKINFEIEGNYQSGKFSALNISAYSILADINITVLPAKKGIIGFAINVASGDKNRLDNKLNTYNLLYAKPAYGLAIPIGASNIISISPYIKINPLQKLNVLTQVFFLSRKSNQDGTYSPAMLQNRPRADFLFSSKKKTLGLFFIIETNYQITKNLSIAFDYSFLKAGSYAEATGNGKNISYVSFKSTFKF